MANVCSVGRDSDSLGLGHTRLFALAAGLLAAGLLPRPGAADTAVGDAGHYLVLGTKVYLNNPAGKAFRVTVHRFPWWIGRGWNDPNLPIRITAPGGKTAFEKSCRIPDGGYAIDLPAGAKGVYCLGVPSGNGLNYWYVTSSLNQAVAGAPPAEGDAVESGWFICNPFVPRRWHFWVPKGTAQFVVRAQNCLSRSQREDHGLTVISPRGQRIAVLWGQAAPDAKPVGTGSKARAEQRARVLVEPGTAGRFWSVEARMGDSHTYTDVTLCLEGVPPYLARSPEEWFDAKTGSPAPVAAYDTSQFVQSDRGADAENKRWRHWTPCPSLGDPDACELRCPARLALWNPQGRALKLVIGTYLPRNMFPGPRDPRTGQWPRLPDAQHDHAELTVTAPGGKVCLKDRAPLKHLHDSRHPGYTKMLRTGKGVVRIDVAAAENFWCYTYPATPAVMVGRAVDGSWRRFHFEAGTARNWYFLVPKATQRFAVRASAAHTTDVMHLAVNAPDRTMAVLYDNAGERSVGVPAGLDGKIWHVRVDFGGSTRFAGRLASPRLPSLAVTLDLKGVPGLLAPTWEQWFDPDKPLAPAARCRAAGDR